MTEKDIYEKVLTNEDCSYFWISDSDADSLTEAYKLLLDYFIEAEIDLSDFPKYDDLQIKDGHFDDQNGDEVAFFIESKVHKDDQEWYIAEIK